MCFELLIIITKPKYHSLGYISIRESLVQHIDRAQKSRTPIAALTKSYCMTPLANQSGATHLEMDSPLIGMERTTAPERTFKAA